MFTAPWADTIGHHGPTPYGTIGRHHRAPWADTIGHHGPTPYGTMGRHHTAPWADTIGHHGPTPYGTMGRHHRALWADTIRHYGPTPYGLLALCRIMSYTLQSRYVTYTIVHENFLHLTVESCRLGPLCRKISCTSLKKLKYFLHVPEVCFPHLASEY